MNPTLATLCGVSAVALVASSSAARITLDLDYSLDTNSFFNSGTANGQLARATLERAADTFADRFLDNLTAVGDAPVTFAPDLLNDWTPTDTHPGTGETSNVPPGLNAVNANVIKIFAGGRDLPGTTIGLGGGGGASFSYYEQSWLDNVESRGQSGVLSTPATDYAPWGGSITFDPGITWNLGLANPASGQNDFLSVALHELGHLLGVGGDSFQALISGSTFTGPKSTAAHGGTVTIADGGHLSALNSTVTGTDSQGIAMSPSISVGSRKRLTLLDWAVLDDLGWDLARPGDANADATVNFADLVRLAQNYNQSGTSISWSEGDFNYDLTVNFADLVALARNYNTTGALSLTAAETANLGASFTQDWALAQTLVPEPSVLMAAGALMLVGFRRSRPTAR